MGELSKLPNMGKCELVNGFPKFTKKEKSYMQ